MKTERADETLILVEQVAGAALVAGELAEFFGALERIRVGVLLAGNSRTVAPEAEKSDRLLTTAQLVERTGLSAWWIRQNKDALPIVRLPTGSYRFSERGLERWLERRAKG